MACMLLVFEAFMLLYILMCQLAVVVVTAGAADSEHGAGGSTNRVLAELLASQCGLSMLHAFAR